MIIRCATYLSLVFICITSADAQFLSFGRNKINYSAFDWHILKTDHFDIYYYPEEQVLTERGAYFAESSFHELEQKFNFTISQRIPLIFYSSQIHFQQTNITPGFIPEGVGGFFEFLKGRVVLPSNGSTEQFRHVIQHELTHVFMHNRIDHILHLHNQPSDRYPPLWFVEGLAEYFSTDWDSQAEMVLRDAVLTGYFVPISNMSAISGSYLMYKEGQAALQFMAERFGKETIRLLIENFWKATNFSDVMKLTINQTYEEFDAQWMYSLKKKYYPLLKTHDDPSITTKEIIRYGFNSKPTYYKHGDSTYVFYIGNITGYTSIYQTSLNGGEPELLIQGEMTDEFEAFHSFQSRMSISNDGLLTFVTKSGESDVLHLYNLISKKHERTLQFKDLVMLGSPSWSPDAKRIVFSAINNAGDNDLYIIDLESLTLERLTNDYYDDRDPAWSPDGNTIAFTSDRTPFGKQGKYNLFLYNLGSASIQYVTYDSANYYSPSWSMDGKMLAFTSDRDGTQNLFILKRDSTDGDTFVIRQLSHFTTSAFDPVWTEKGNLIFSVFNEYNFQIRGLADVASRFDSTSISDICTKPDSAYMPWKAESTTGTTTLTTLKYKREFQLDIAQSQISTDPVFGTIGGATLSLSDVLGNDQYYFLLYNTAQSSDEILSSFNIAISRVSLNQRTPFAYGIYHYSGRRYDLLDPDQYFYERAFGGYFAVSYPFSKFRRIEGAVNVGSSDKSVIADVKERKALLVTNSLSYVKDNALYYWTGPIDGNRFNVTLSYTTDIQYSNVNYFSVMADYRRYFRIDQRTAYATRIELLYNEGKEARRFLLGGSWDLRGWPWWSIRGTKRWLTSHELRFPLLDSFGFNFPFGNVTLGLIRGALFFDAGNAWDSKYGETLGSIGFGLRFNVLGVLVLRYDIGKRIENNFSTFQNGLFQQFFFGWDF